MTTLDTAPASGTTSLALGGFVVGLVALVLVLVPELTVVSLVGGAAGVVLGIVALRGVVPGGGGQGQAITAIVLGALAVVSTPPLHLVPEDLSYLDCDALADEALAIYGVAYEDEAVLVALHDLGVAEDHRDDYSVPRGFDVSVVLSCEADAEWDDGTRVPSFVDLSVDSDGEIWVDLVEQG